jgi:hypothetical protein
MASHPAHDAEGLHRHTIERARASLLIVRQIDQPFLDQQWRPLLAQLDEHIQRHHVI